MSYRKEAEELFLKSYETAKSFYDKAELVRVHSKNVADAAEVVVQKLHENGHTELDSDMAYICGLMHDIGKAQEGCNGLNHPMLGYKVLMEQGWEMPAQVAMTHTYYGYKYMDYSDFWERFDDDNEKKFTQDFLEKVELTDYDRLIQLLDNMANHRGVMSIADRFSDIQVRHNIRFGGSHLKELYRLKMYFDKKCGMNIYELFKDDIIRLTFDEPNQESGIGKILKEENYEI